MCQQKRRWKVQREMRNKSSISWCCCYAVRCRAEPSRAVPCRCTIHLLSHLIHHIISDSTIHPLNRFRKIFNTIKVYFLLFFKSINTRIDCKITTQQVQLLNSFNRWVFSFSIIPFIYYLLVNFFNHELIKIQV